MPQKPLRINFIGSFTTGYVGEVSDETHLAQELENLGCEVQRVPRDIWKAICDGEWDETWEGRTPIFADINIVCKWNYFDKPLYIENLRKVSKAPVLYWTWDYMDYNEDGFHYITAKAADLLLTNDGLGRVPTEIKWQYFPFDVADKNIRFNTQVPEFYKHDVTFFGSYLKQGDRIEWLTELNKHVNLDIFSWNYEEWRKNGFKAEPAVYGDDFSKEIAQSKVIVGFNVNDHTWGYWSNRVGKVLTLGGCLLYRYVPGMELFLRDGVDYFSTKEEMVAKVKKYVENSEIRYTQCIKAFEIGRNRFTSEERIKDLYILLERYIAGGI